MSSQSLLPPRPNLEQLRKQAKSLLKAHKSGDSGVIPRLRLGISRLAEASDPEILGAKFSLLDARLVIAREQGFRSWQELEAAIQDAAAPGAAEAFMTLAIGDIRKHTHQLDDGREVESYLVLLEEEDGERMLPILIEEALVISLVMGLRGISLPRPLAHDLTTALMQSMHAKPVELRISDYREWVFYATLVVENDDGTHEIDCRPSDGMCIAVRGGAPVVISEQLMNRVGQEKREPLDGSGIDAIAARLGGSRSS